MSILKKCKGTGKAKGEGCGQDLQYTERGGMKVYFSKFGLGTSGCRCFYSWFESPEPIKKISNKRKVENKEYNKLRKAFLAENTVCFIEGCNKVADTIEHTAGRGINYLNVDTWKPCCLEHNLELENNPELSKKYQLSKIHGGKKIDK